jgi:hypothetical protein
MSEISLQHQISALRQEIEDQKSIFATDEGRGAASVHVRQLEAALETLISHDAQQSELMALRGLFVSLWNDIKHADANKMDALEVAIAMVGSGLAVHNDRLELTDIGEAALKAAKETGNAHR